MIEVGWNKKQAWLTDNKYIDFYSEKTSTTIILNTQEGPILKVFLGRKRGEEKIISIVVGKGYNAPGSKAVFYRVFRDIFGNIPKKKIDSWLLYRNIPPANGKTVEIPFKVGS